MCDWDALTSEYITTDLTLVEMSKKHNISIHTLNARCGKYKWVEQRKEYKRQAIELALNNAAEAEAERLGKIITSAQQMADVIEDIFRDPQQFHRHIVTDTFINEDGGKDILTVEKEFQKVDSRAIKDLTGALKDMTLVLRNLYNLPTQAEREAQRIAAERLNMDLRKAEAEGSTDKTVKVVLTGEWEDYAK